MNTIAQRFAVFEQKQNYYLERKKVLIDALNQLKLKKDVILEAQQIVQALAENIQNKLSFKLTGLVNKALADIFSEENLEFGIEFNSKRGKVECNFFILSNGTKVHPYDACGGGLADIVSFSLRVIFLLMRGGRKVLFLDEPFKNLDQEKKPKAALLLKEISETLDIQIVMVTHDKVFQDVSDIVYQVNKDFAGVSKLCL